MVQQQQQQIKPVLSKVESVSAPPPNIQPKVAPQPQKTLTIRPSGQQQPIQPASTVSTQTSVAVSTSKAVAKVKLNKAARPVAKALTPDANKQQPQQLLQPQVTSSGQQIIVNK
jgi:hypothetical protein